MVMLRYIRVDSDKCSGCRSCEVVCSAFHAAPKYSLTNPKRSRIRVFWDEADDLFVPISIKIGSSGTRLSNRVRA